jgi:DNA-binding GntR family transcriptional regulator
VTVPADPRRYVQVHAALRSDIETGRVREGDRLNIGALAHEHGVARDTVRKALDRLAAEHLIWYVDGLGWYAGREPDAGHGR